MTERRRDPNRTLPARGRRAEIRNRDALLAGAGVALGGMVLLLSGRLPWFRSAIGASKTHDVDGFRSGSWLFGVPIGWILLAVGIALVAMALSLAAPRLARWSPPPLWLPPLLSGATLGWILLDRSYVHREVRADLKRAIDEYVTRRPDQAAQAKALLASSRLTDGSGLWIAVIAAAAVTLVGVWLVRRSRLKAASGEV